MPSDKAAIFCTDKNELEHQVKQILDGQLTNVPEGKAWFKIIVGPTPTKASKQIWDVITNLLE